MAETQLGGSLLRVVSEGQLQQKERDERDAAIAEATTTPFESDLGAFIRKSFDLADWHREDEGIVSGMLDALRALRGKYEPDKLAQIQTFKGSEVYSRLSAVKCRSASAILRDIYLNSDVPWSLSPTPDPVVPSEVQSSVVALINSEVQTLKQQGLPVENDQIDERRRQLQDSAEQAGRKQARQEAKEATRKLNDILSEGGFYEAMSEFLIDLPVFHYACIKGPVVRKSSQMKWKPGGKLEISDDPRMFWNRVSPLDLWLAPGATSVDHGAIMERIRITRDELFDLIGLPGYNEAYIRSVLASYDSTGLEDWHSTFESTRATLEKRENPNYDFAGPFIDTLEYHGYVRGEHLTDWGYEDAAKEEDSDKKEEGTLDPDKEYYVTAWLIDQWVIKAQINPNPRKKPIYYITSFEKIPGSVYGQGLPNILHDIQEVSNATLRALVNNLGIASGPQVIVDDDRVAPNTDSDSLYPWKRWHVVSDPLSNNQPPVSFYQPDSRSQELLVVYEKFTQMADEVSAIPRYMSGSQRTGGAASTASGLSMLMSNNSKIMQQVASNIDNDVMEPVLEQLYDMVMLTDQGKTLRGDESIMVRGVSTAVKREQDRMRQLEFLQITANDIDSGIVGPEGRAAILRAVATGLGLDGEQIVPDENMMKQQMAAAQQASQQPAPGGAGDGAQPHMNTQSNARQAGT